MGTDSRKEERRKCALTSTGLLMEGLGFVQSSLLPCQPMRFPKFASLGAKDLHHNFTQPRKIDESLAASQPRVTYLEFPRAINIGDHV